MKSTPRDLQVPPRPDEQTRLTPREERRRRLGPAALEHIKKLVDEAPPLTADQRAVLGMLLRRGAQRRKDQE